MNVASKHVRMPAVAGVFYPDQASRLQRQIADYLRDADPSGPYPKALIVPHAGFVYSGPVAASGYCLLKPIRHIVERVVLLGPSHHVRFYGLAASGAEQFITPLGEVPIDLKLVRSALRLPQVHLLEDAHLQEHSLEVQLPFLQMTLDDFSLVPMVVGAATVAEVGETIDSLWDEMTTLVVVSSDLSHYLEYWTARGLDSQTAQLIERYQWRQLTGERACGYVGIRGLLKVAQERRLRIKTVDLRNSGDTHGPKDRVVGYGSFVVY